MAFLPIKEKRLKNREDCSATWGRLQDKDLAMQTKTELNPSSPSVCGSAVSPTSLKSKSPKCHYIISFWAESLKGEWKEPQNQWEWEKGGKGG